MALACLLTFVLGAVFDASWISENDWIWFLLLWAGVAAGIIAAFIGSLGWIDVRRGVTEEGLTQSKIGALLGGTVASLIVISFLIIVVVFFWAFSVSPPD